MTDLEAFEVILIPLWKSLSCVRLCDPMNCSLPGSSVHGMLQARILEWVAFSRGSSQPRDQTQFYHIAGRFFIIWATREANTPIQNRKFKVWGKNLDILKPSSWRLNHKNLKFMYDVQRYKSVIFGLQYLHICKFAFLTRL